MYETFDHTADIGVRVRAGSLPDLFADAAAGLFSLITDQQPPDGLADSRSFSISGSEPSYLLFDWLAELLFLFDTAHLALYDFDVTFSEHGLDATASVWPLDPTDVKREVKAITYHRLAVEEREDGWMAEYIVDI